MFGVKTAHRSKFCVHCVHAYTAVGMYVDESGDYLFAFGVNVKICHCFGEGLKLSVFYNDIYSFAPKIGVFNYKIIHTG